MRPSIVADEVRTALFDYLRTTFAFSDAAFEAALFDFLESELVKGPWVHLDLPFRVAPRNHPNPLDVTPTRPPYAHQYKAFERLTTKDGHAPQSTLVTTGTGSGKTECFLWPILDHCLRHSGDKGIKAIILYPMNALATDQAKRIAKLVTAPPFAGKVRAGLYVGGKGRHATLTPEHLIDDRKILRQAPPDILLTNYRMLDFLLLRPEDQALWAHEGEGLKYLVLDELHTYDGAQATDVACLVRRLKRRLEREPGALACVGTSATLGGRGGADASQPLRDFAREIFDEPFELDAVITEARLDIEEALGEHQRSPDDDTLDRIPTAADIPQLDSAEHPDAATWRRHLELQFLGSTGDPDSYVSSDDPVELAALLARHRLLRQLLEILRRGPQTVDQLIDALVERDPELGALDDQERRAVLDAFLVLVGEARRRTDSGELVPFLQLRVQLWVRELRRLLMKIPEAWDDGPVFRFADAAGADETSQAKALPVAHCRHCGGHGLAATRKAGHKTLRHNPREIGQAWLEGSPDAQYVLLEPDADTPDLLPRRLDPDRLDISADRGPRIGLYPPERPPRFTSTCPECGEQDNLRILGARGPSLLSVAVSHLFLTDHNDDRKLLTFVDRVQDASHLAGFFAARTYRFNFRTALQGALLAVEGERGAPLAGLSKQLYTFARAQLPDEPTVVATLMPHDLKSRPAYHAWHEAPNGPALTALRKDLAERLEWEVTREYGLATYLGRTLERTGSSCAHPESERLTQAAERLAADLAEQGVLQLAERPPTVAEARAFLAGLCHRLRTRGGIRSPLLAAYVHNDGNRYLLSKRHQPLLGGFGRFSPVPRFLTDAFKPKTFDSRYSSPSQPTWLRRYAAAALGTLRQDEGINEAVKKALNRLGEAGIIREHRAANDVVYGLDPAHLIVTSKVDHLECKKCRRGVVVPAWEVEPWTGSPCLHFRCDGRLEPSARAPKRFYRKIYGSGRLQRIFSGEHTGLLERTTRENLEERFKEGAKRHPEAENVLVATPTLEMGIDIGDLSAVALAGVPPGPANYLQRVGRAGRSTGRALVVTLAEARPHDGYFFEDPTTMLAGDVRPPGCYLNAPEMLKRQLVAFAMDRWAAQQDDIHDIPRRTRAVLGAARPTSFVGRFVAHWAANRAAIFEAFVTLFAGVDAAHLERVETFALSEPDGLSAAVNKAFDDIEAEQTELNRLIRRVSDRLKKLEVDTKGVSEPDRLAQELEDDRRMLRHARELILDKYPLNTLTDAGVLPNYAFPEPGVTLQSKVRRASDDGNKRGKVETFEYQRPASSALRELAPFNTFYAEGRKVRVGEIDIGSKEKSLVESWRFCPACAHAAREHEVEGTTACPRCGHVGWADNGQRRDVVRFVRSRAFSDEQRALVEDDADDRDNMSYQTVVFVDVGPENRGGAVAAAAHGFGVERLVHQTLREVNFGFDVSLPRTFVTYDTRQPDEAFVVCEGCGKVKPPHNVEGGELKHLSFCPYAKNAALEPKLKNVALLRELESEAVRIMLPALVSEVPEKLASFQAALDLGFREYFSGRPQHLLTETASEPVPNSIARRHYVVVFDTVPGGTGYLGELMPEPGEGHERGLMRILAMALAVMQACRCKSEGLDGCHRCVRGFQPNHRLPHISRRVAERLLSDFIDHASELEPVATLSDVPLEQRIESELEVRFVARLRKWAEDKGGRLDLKLHAGEEAYELSVGDVVWRVGLQIDLGKGQGVSVATRPDFVLTPLVAPAGTRSVAIYCDGFAYHAMPDAPVGRIGDDVRKRAAILASGAYRVWSLGWKDLDDDPDVPKALVPDTDVGRNSVAYKLKGDADTKLPSRGVFETLTRYLVAPNDALWVKQARLHLAGAMAGGPWVPQYQTSAVLDSLSADARPTETATLVGDRPDPLGKYYGETSFAAAAFKWPIASAAHGHLEDLTARLRLYDTQAERSAEGFEQDWRRFLQAWAWLQFVPGVEVSTTELRREFQDVEPPPPSTADLLPEDRRTALEDCLDLIDDDTARILIEALATWDAPLPEPGWDIGPDGLPGDLIELAWPDVKLGVVVDGQETGRASFEARGWTIHHIDELKGAQQLHMLITGEPVPPPS
ncbi:MAG: DEAD/DEAH box helicase [Deltaproteobacteria bacterium]